MAALLFMLPMLLIVFLSVHAPVHAAPPYPNITREIQSSPDDTVSVILDTDMDTDCDDAGALAMLHAMADRGDVRILATMVSSRHEYSAPTVDAINTYYGHPDIPIGVPKGEGASLERSFPYTTEIARNFTTDIPNNDAAPDALETYRRILSEQPDSSVVLVTVGYLTNVRDLVESLPDAISPLSGKELAHRKIKRWVVMGGRYPQNMDHGNYGNFMPDPESAVVATIHGPRPTIFSGDGTSIQTGSTLDETPTDNPVRQAYELYLGDVDKERSSWDQVALYYAVHGPDPFWREVTQGYNRIFDNGTNEWRERPDSDHMLIKLTDRQDELERRIEKLMSAAPSD